MWARTGLLPEALTALSKLGHVKPTAIQQLAVPRLLEGKSAAFAASTGSGKTLAFLLPVMQRLRAGELAAPPSRGARRAEGPGALVLAPTRELVRQVYLEAKAISHHLRLRVRELSGGTRLSAQRAKLASGVDLLVATPSRLRLLLRRQKLSLRGVRCVVVDEADDVLLRGFADDLDHVLRACPQAAGGATVQMVFVSATLAGEARHRIRSRWPEAEVLLTECAHRPPGALRHRMELVRGDKLEALLRLLAGADDTRTIVFCRGVQSARAVALALEADGFRVSSSHGSMPERMRRRYLADFVADDTPRKPILVSTDLAARGLNLPGVEHIVNFDFPASAALYLHRAGRAGRMGAPGRVTSLLKRSEVPLGEAVQAAIGRRAELPPVRAAPKAGAGATEGPALPAATTTPSARELSAAGRSVALARATARRANARRQAREQRQARQQMQLGSRRRKRRK